MISELKSKLPFGKKVKSFDDESEKIKANSYSSRNSDATDSADISDLEIPDDTTADDEVKKKKKKSKTIQLIIGAGLVVFIFSDYIIPTEESVVVPKLKPVKRSKKLKVDATTAAETSSEAKTEPTSEASSEVPIEATAETSSEVPTESKTETPSEVSVEIPAVVSNEATTIEAPTEPSITPLETPASGSVTVSETVEAPATEIANSGVSTDGIPSQQASTDSVDGGETTSPGEENITDQILEDLEKQTSSTPPIEQKKEYVAPPDYEYRGRGLVYNCTGKHWACVDGPSYKSCEDNFSSVKYLGKQIECYPFNVYETPKGCDIVQNRMVSSSAKTEFCNE